MTARALRRSRFMLLVLLIGFASAAAVYARGWMTPGFRNKQARPLRLALLPPHADFIKSKIVMTDQMLSESAALEREASLALKSQLEEKGYAVRLLAEAELAKNPALRQLAVKVNDRFGEEWSKMVRYPRGVKQKRHTCGEDAVRLASLLKVDGLAVVRIIAVGQTKGRATFSAIMNLGSPSQTSYARLDLGVINGRQGQVEAFFSGYEPSSLSQLTKKPSKVMGQASENALHRYPGVNDVDDVVDDEVAPAAQRKGSRGDAEDEAAIQDFEALLGSGKSSTTKK